MSAVNDLVKAYQHIIDELTLVMGSRGVFDVVVDGDLLYSKAQTGRQAAPGEILDLFEQRYAQGQRRFAR